MLETHDPQGSLVGATLGNYHVTGRIGAGGMGVVYRAKDLRLDRTVAVKALPEASGADPIARRRLMDEARRGSRVASPYCATVFDVVEQDERAYIVMEYIEGRRLDAVLRDDRPGVAPLTSWAIEIAEALTAIHGAGLVHKDLKPANVIITPTGHVKVMDFGLAREDAAAALLDTHSDSTLSTQTNPGAIAGTILYMSPEQVRGEHLDARSDLFSFGTLLCESVTGSNPFERESLLASASAILHDRPKALADSPQLTSSPLAPIVNHLLEKDRDLRYQSSDVVLQDLRALRTGSGAGAAVVARWTAARLAVVAASVAAAMTTVALVAYTLWPKQPHGPLPGSRPVLAVLPFEDRTGQPGGESRAQLLADLLATDLSESSLVRALPTDRVRDIFLSLGGDAKRPAVIAAISKAADVQWIVSGTLYKETDALYASVGVYWPGESEPSVSFRANAGSIAAIAELASVQLRDRLFPRRKDAKGPGVTKPFGESTSEVAQLLEQDAKKALRELRYDDAIEKLDKAVQLDPGFLRAQVRLADVLDRAGYLTRARDIVDRASKAVEQSGDAARSETVGLEARAVYARVHGDPDGELAARRDLVAKHGDDPTPHLDLARALDRRGRTPDALSEVDLAIALDAKDPGARLLKGRLLSKAKRFDEAQAAIDRAEALVKETKSDAGRAAVDRVRGESEFLHERYAAAGEFYQSASRAYVAAGLDFSAAQCRKAVGDCELKQGNLKAAVEIYEPVLAAARLAGDHRTIIGALSSLGGQYQLRGKYESAAKVLREAREDALAIGNPLLLLGPTLNLASALGSLGHGEEARALADEALALARTAGNTEIEAKAMLLLANAQYRDGHLDEAIRIYREVLNSPTLANAPGAPPGNAHLGLAQILRQTGRLKDAAESSEQAVAVNRAGKQRALLGYSLVERSRIRVDLGLDSEAATDLDEAATLAASPAPPLEDLQIGVGVARATLAGARSRWDEAERVLEGLRQGSWSEPGALTESSVLEIAARVANERDHPQDAIRNASDAVSNRDGSPVNRAGARIELAAAYARTARKSDAASEAQRALDEADRMSVPILTAAACAMLMNLGGNGASEANRTHGLAALQRYVDAAPESRRESVRSRADVKAIARALESHGSARQDR